MNSQVPSNRSAKGVLTPAERVKTIVYRGKKLLQVDFSNSTVRDIMQVIEFSRKHIDAQPPKSLLIFTDLTNTAVEPQVVQALRDFAKNNAPYVKASAIIGLSGPTRLVLTAINKFSGRNIMLFEDSAIAKNWLINQ